MRASRLSVVAYDVPGIRDFKKSLSGSRFCAGMYHDASSTVTESMLFSSQSASTKADLCAVFDMDVKE